MRKATTQHQAVCPPAKGDEVPLGAGGGKKQHKIGWLNLPGYRGETWNPIIGCSKVSDGCKNCYAEKMAHRLAHIPGTSNNYMNVMEIGQDKTGTLETKKSWNGKTRFVQSAIDKPLHWKKPRVIFVCSMGDLFHEDTPWHEIDNVFATMALADQHIFIVLTKRPHRMVEYFNRSHANGYLTDQCNYITDKFIRPLEQALYLDDEIKHPLPNVWLGVTAENQKTANERIPALLQVPAAVRLVSVEPMLSKVNLKQEVFRNKNGEYPFPKLSYKYRTMWLDHLNWVICGGESGHNARPMHPDWARSLRDQCNKAGVPFFFKQWGEWSPFKYGGRGTKDFNWCEYGLPFQWMCNIGKHKSGNLLDGVKHEEYPALPPDLRQPAEEHAAQDDKKINLQVNFYGKN